MMARVSAVRCCKLVGGGCQSCNETEWEVYGLGSSSPSRENLPTVEVVMGGLLLLNCNAMLLVGLELGLEAVVEGVEAEGTLLGRP